MSIHVTVNGTPVNIRHGKMVLSDLDQIKKNERDRRRRLRLEQVRQQSKEISNRLLERAKKLAREELSKLEKDGKSELKQMHDRKIMEIQQKYQEDLEDIGQAHISAALQPDIEAITEKEARRDRAAALKRGQDAIQRMKEAKQKDSAEATHQEKLYKIQQIENTRDTIKTKLPKQTISKENSRTDMNSSEEEDTSEENVHKMSTPKKRNRKVLPKKSPRKLRKSNMKEHQKMSIPKPGPSGLQKQFTVQLQKTPSKKKESKVMCVEYITDDASEDQLPRKTMLITSTTPTKIDKTARYDPKDYTQIASNTTSISSSSSSSSISDDSSYFSDGAEQIVCKAPKSASLTNDKVLLYDHSTRQRNFYDRPLGIVERIDIQNEPNAVETAQAMKSAESIKAHVTENHKLSAQRRSEDAILREKVRKDYQTLMENLDHLAQEERKLKASQIQSNAEEDTHMRLHQRSKHQEEYQKKLDRATVEILSTDKVPSQYSQLTERVVTLPTQRKNGTHSNVPHSTWQEPHLFEEETDVCHTQQNKDSEVSREEQILDMLKKVEKQKRLLLQEFGASLPDDIFNVSIKPLFEAETSAKVLQGATKGTAKSLSPEIKVINMSSCDECVKKNRKTKKLDKPHMKKIEIAVQAALDKTTPAEDKSVQVELSQENIDIRRSSKDTTTQRPHPIEPKITIITPETDDSSNDSTSSEISGMIIEIDKKEVTVTPKKRKSMKISKQLSPRVYQKIRSTSTVSKATSPIKRFTRSQSSLQKKARCTDTPHTTSRRVDIHVSKSDINDEIEPSQERRISIDASAESSQAFSGMNDQDQSSSKPYRIRTQVKRWIRIKDTSDTSTSFASPPPIKPKSMVDALTNVTPILEMLDSLGPEEFRRPDISPVSTPETPSPRTMMMPSNIPHRDRISRMLRYNSIDSQTNDSTVLSSTQNDQSTITDPSDIRQQESIVPVECATSSQQPSISSKVCTCKNPECKLLHTKFEDIHDYALKNCPEILQKYEDLQNLCTERIASLTDLIEKVRSEQKDMDFSLISPSDETSLMQISPSKPARNDVQAVRKLVDSIEAVHAQLAKTLLESQRIIGNNAISEDEISNDTEVQAITSTPRSKSIDTVLSNTQKSAVLKGKVKPKIISDEKVNLQLNRFKMQQKPQALLITKPLDRNSRPSCTTSPNEEEVAKQKDFIPILSSIPKTSRTHGTLTSINARTKPPVTLLNGPYRPELESSGHELSTIVEFDTPDNVSRSVNTPTKSRNINASNVEHLQKTLLKRIVDTDPFKSAIMIKPSVHVAPLPVQQNQNFSKRSTSSMKRPTEKSTSAQGLQETATICNSPGKLTDVTDCTAATKNDREWVDSIFEKCNKQLQCNTTNEEPAPQTKDRLGYSISTDFNNLYKNSKHKTTSTSLNSFSGLSGISEITSSPSDIPKYASSPEEIEIALKKLGLGWAVTTLKKTREASALSSSSNSDITPINTARRMISPTKKHFDPNGLLDFSDVSSISIKEASKSTEQAVLLKGRTSTPKLQNTNSNSERSSSTSGSLQEPSDSITVPNVSLTKTKSDNKQLQNP